MKTINAAVLAFCLPLFVLANCSSQGEARPQDTAAFAVSQAQNDRKQPSNQRKQDEPMRIYSNVETPREEAPSNDITCTGLRFANVSDHLGNFIESFDVAVEEAAVTQAVKGSFDHV